MISLVTCGQTEERETPTNRIGIATISKPLAAVLSPAKWRQVEASVDHALANIASRQAADGSFRSIPAGQPGVTSLCVMAFLSRGHLPGLGPYGERLNRAIDFVIACQRSDGLLSKVAPGAEWQRYLSRRSRDERSLKDADDLNWKAAIHFIQSCQNLRSYNSEAWASDDPQNKGGFIYAPGRSMAGETNLAMGRVALRSYGSMSYAGLLSYIYADIKRDDPRVIAVMDWLRANFTLDENPAMGPQGLYYYYHTMAKALTVYGVDTLDTKDGRHIKWRELLALKLINLQHADGSWSNENGRWFEKDPILVTAYSIIALDIIQTKL